jgi:UDP-galactose transporter B1
LLYHWAGHFKLGSVQQQQTVAVVMALSNELRLGLYILSLYTVFIYWGFLQEKLTTTQYDNGVEKMKWTCAVALNCIMATVCASTAGSVLYYTTWNQQQQQKQQQQKYRLFWKAAATSALASPIGYASLAYLSYPLMILVKAMKPVPVMIIGMLSYNRRYSWYKWLSVSLLVVGVSLFSVFKSKSTNAVANAAGGGVGSVLVGMFLVLLNLSLDGVTNNEQDHLFSRHNVSPLEMMKVSVFALVLSFVLCFGAFIVLCVLVRVLCCMSSCLRVLFCVLVCLLCCDLVCVL